MAIKQTQNNQNITNTANQYQTPTIYRIYFFRIFDPTFLFFVFFIVIGTIFLESKPIGGPQIQTFSGFIAQFPQPFNRQQFFRTT